MLLTQIAIVLWLRTTIQIGFLSLREKTSTRLAFLDFDLSLEGIKLEKFESSFWLGRTKSFLRRI